MTIPAEQWRPVPGYEELYEVSDQGRVRSLGLRGRILRGSPVARSYVGVSLWRDGSQRTHYMHQLVLAAFVGPRPSPDHQACHNDGDGQNNQLSNLRWDTRSANARDRQRHGTEHNANLTHCKRDHEFTPENTYRRPSGTGRECRTCKAAARKAVPAGV